MWAISICSPKRSVKCLNNDRWKRHCVVNLFTSSMWNILSFICLHSFICFLLFFSLFSQLYNQCPTLMQFLPGRHQSAFSNLTRIKQFIKQEVERHREDRNPSDPRDYIDCYLEEIEKVETMWLLPHTYSILSLSLSLSLSIQFKFNQKRLYWHDCIQYNVAKACLHKMYKHN